MPDVIGTMLANRRLERVRANPDHALSVLDMAHRHVRTAEEHQHRLARHAEDACHLSPELAAHPISQSR